MSSFEPDGEGQPVPYSINQFAYPGSGGPARDILDSIIEIDNLLLAPEGPQQIYSGVAQITARAFDVPLAALLLFEDGSGAIRLAGVNHASVVRLLAGGGLDPPVKRRFEIAELQETPWVEPLAERTIYLTSRPQDLIAPAMTHNRAEAVTRLLGLRLGIVVSLFARDRKSGALLLGSTRSELAPQEQSDLAFFARHTAAALEMWRLLDRAEGRTTLLGKLHALSQAIASILDFDELYAEIARAAGQLAEIDFCTVNTLTQDRQAYENRAAWGRGTRGQVVEGAPSLHVLPPALVRKGLSGEPVLLPDVGDYPEVARRLEARGARAMALFPFKSSGEVAGFLTVGREQPGEWHQDDIQVLVQLSEYVTVAFTNAELYTRARRRAERMAILRETGEQLARIRRPELLFKSLKDAIQSTLHASEIEISLWRDEKSEREIVLDVVDGEDRPPRAMHGSAHDPADYVISTCQTFHNPDTTGVGSRESGKHRVARSVLSVPLLSGNRAIGAVTLRSERAFTFDPEDVQTAQLLAAQAAVTLDNIRLLQSRERQATEQTALAHSARMIAQADTDSVLQAIVKAASNLTLQSPCSIFLFEDDALVCEEAYGAQYGDALSMRGQRVEKGPDAIWRVFETGQPILISDPPPGQNVRAPHFLKSLIIVPLRTGDRRIGVLSATNHKADVYSPSHLKLLTTLANYAAIALEKGRLLREAKLQAAEQQAIAESARAIARLDVGSVLQTIVSKASEIVVASSRCTLLLYDEKTDELYWAAGHNNQEAFRNLRLRANSGIIGRIFTTGEPLLLSDLQADPRSVRHDVDRQENAHSFIGVPLGGASGNVGVLVAMNEGVGVFTQRDLRVLTTFADHATIALVNARLYSSLEQREAERNRLMQQILTSQEAERRRVAVDMHDGPLQSIGVNLLAIDRMRKHLREDHTGRALEELDEVRSGMASVVQELRDVISDLRPALLETQGLLVATRAYLNRFAEQHDLQAVLEDDMGERRVPHTVEVIFYRLMQEALTNVRKHAGATTVWVRLNWQNGRLEMQLTDDGRGFDSDSAMARAVASGHIGLHSMWERLDAIGGGLSVDSAHGQGTTISFWAPVPEPAAPERRRIKRKRK